LFGHGYERVMSMGYVHSVEAGSFVDGPGTRFVVFLSGCPLSCQYCHNPDVCRVLGEHMSSDAVVARIARTADFLNAAGGGVTVSGGEPLTQARFVLEILKGAKALGLHTALDTSGYLDERVTDEMLENLDLVLLDIKSWDEATYREVTGVELAPTIRLARRLSAVCKPMWIRFVLVPGLTDDADNITGLARFVAGLTNVERVEIVPFHQMGRHKWEELGIPYRLSDTRPPSAQEMRRAKDLFEAAGVHVGVQHLPPCEPDARTTEVEHDAGR
jgi:pyruvate formate lyase activating enzyme